MDKIKFELDKDSLEAAVMAVTSGDNECPRCGFVLTVEKGES